MRAKGQRDERVLSMTAADYCATMNRLDQRISRGDELEREALKDHKRYLINNAKLGQLSAYAKSKGTQRTAY